MKRIDIVLPVYNEEECLRVFHAALTAVLGSLAGRYRFEIIYVLDRSSDNSFGVLKEIAEAQNNVTVIHLSRRFGHQMSLVAGIDHSRGDAVIMMDCDLQHPPCVIPLLLEKFEQGFDVVHTIRRYSGQIGFAKRWTSALFYGLQNLLSPVPIRDGAADFRLISRKVAEVFQTSIREQNQFLRGLVSWVGFASATVEFVSPPRAAGSSKYHLLRLLAFSIAGITSFSKVPLRLGTLIGFAISAICGLYGITVIVEYFSSGSFPAGYTSLFVGLLFLGGLQLIVLGIIGEYLAGVFDEVKRRPLYVIDQLVESRAPAVVDEYATSLLRSDRQ